MYRNMAEKLTTKLLDELLFSRSLEHFLQENEQEKPSLAGILNQLLTEKKLCKNEVINRSQLNKTFAYQIFSGDRMAKRDKVLQLAFAMSLSLKETQKVLRAAGANELHCKNNRDAIIIFYLEKGQPLSIVEDSLFYYKERTICDK